EAITNSRFGVVDPAGEAPQSVLAQSREDKSKRKYAAKQGLLQETKTIIAADGRTISEWGFLRATGHFPANCPDELSPADRMFGWVRQYGVTGERTHAQTHDAVRGALRIDPPVIENETERESSDVIELATLATPKTTQRRFYLANIAETPSGTGGSQSNPLEGIHPKTQLRGRKVYLPHRETFDKPEYWAPSSARQESEAQPYQEYARPEGESAPNTMNWYIDDYIPPGSIISTTLRVAGVSALELGALLWLLALNDDVEFTSPYTGAALGIGHGKPLGFGSVCVRADWDRTRIWDAASLAKRCTTLTPPERNEHGCDRTHFIELFEDQIEELALKQVRDEFLDAVYGFRHVPVHYPRHRDRDDQGTRPRPKGEQFKWWKGRTDTLPPLGTEPPPTLPYDRPGASGRSRG
ncbi:MAG: hypothetical protein LBJ08_05940, partial [Bifidobacteriaceae bacterium]|nr:hypothetical protein [Bifidobacteriaceae bacterium]